MVWWNLGPAAEQARRWREAAPTRCVAEAAQAQCQQVLAQTLRRAQTWATLGDVAAARPRMATCGATRSSAVHPSSTQRPTQGQQASKPTAPAPHWPTTCVDSESPVAAARLPRPHRRPPAPGQNSSALRLQATMREFQTLDGDAVVTRLQRRT